MSDGTPTGEIDCPAGCGDELNETITEVYAHLVLDCPEAENHV